MGLLYDADGPQIELPLNNTGTAENIC